MKKNIGSTDKLIRLGLALVFLALNFLLKPTGVLSYVIIGAAVVMALTSFLNFCPLYTLFGINTCKLDNKE